MQEKNKETNESEIPEMNLNYNIDKNKKPVVTQNNELAKKELENKKKEIEKFKGFVLKKFKFIRAIGILPPQSHKDFIEEEIGENIPEAEMKKLISKIHVYLIVPEDNFKEIPKIKQEIIKYIEAEKLNLWVYVKTPVDIWETCFDSKFEMSDAIAVSYPIYDTGILQSLRVASIHKSLVLQKFDKYVVSYVIAGSLVRGEAVQTSDVDVFVIINDTDVKKMPRLELKERLKSIIFQYISEATALAGVKKNILNVQPYLLTDFWEAVKDAHPVMFTFIRDGVPLYDKGTFMPWKALLKMGKLKPSPEAIDMFMSMGENGIKRAKNSLLEIAIHDLYWSVITPSQALLMLNGVAPPVPKQIVFEMKKEFIEKEKMLEKKYLDFVESIVKLYKDYEHEKIKEVSGKDIDKFIKDAEDYIKRLKELREQIEKKYQEKTIEQIYKDVFEILKNIIGKMSQEKLLTEFEKDFVKKGKFAKHHLRILRNIISARNEFKKGKSNTQKIDSTRKDAMILINDLIDYCQRCDFVAIDKRRFNIIYDKRGKQEKAEVFITDNSVFLISGKSIKKLGKKTEEIDLKTFTKEIETQKPKKDLVVDSELFSILKNHLGNFRIVF